VMGYRIGMRAIFAGARQSFRLRGVVERDVMHLVTLMQAPDGFERPDLSTARGGVQEIGLHPQQFHRRNGRLAAGLRGVPLV
jgi:hypothetical protein